MSLAATQALSARPLPPLSRMLVTLALRVATWELRRRTRKHLKDMPAHILADIGVDAYDARQEASKPFWRG